MPNGLAQPRRFVETVGQANNQEANMARSEGPFSHLDEAGLRVLVPRGVARDFRKNTVVVNEGDDTNALYVLLSGRLKAFISGDDGREVVLGTIEPGDYFGELVLDGGPRSASIITLEPCRVFVIAQSDVEALLVDNPAFARDLIHKLIGRVRSLTSKVRDLALKDVYGRFVRFIEDNALEEQGQRVISERLTQSEVAARIGGSREMVSRIMRDLTQGGYIDVDAKRIRVLKKLPAHW
jgi:CRP/FNR family cyclic AMP-dependent transcriptional regulator